MAQRRMRNIKMVLEYDGSKFFGFQRQPHHPTIQEELEKALSRLLNQKTKIAAASGRTDTGVHAEYQVVNFKTTSRLPLSRIQKGLNALLPRTLAVKAAEEVPLRFHARFGAREKIYEYRIWNHPTRSPLHAERAYHVPERLDVEKMKRAARVLIGRHDFRSFCNSDGRGGENGASKSRVKNTVRRVKKVQIRKEGPLLRLRFHADGFLYRMVRNLMGALIEVGQGKLRVKDLDRILASKDRKLAPAAVPAHGLVLVHVSYRESSESLKYLKK